MLDTELLLTFLARPRTLAEVAQRFEISHSEAEQQVMKAVKSGLILMSSVPRNRSKSLTGLLRVDRPVSTPCSSSPSQTKLRQRLTQTDNAPSPVKGRVGKDVLLFKFRQNKPNIIRRNASTFQVAEMFGDRVNAQDNRRISLTQELRVLEILSSKPQSFNNLRTEFDVSRKVVGRMVLAGLVRCDWGPKGIGNIYKITQQGREELQRLRMASSVDSRVLKKPLVSLKVMAPQMSR